MKAKDWLIRLYDFNVIPNYVDPDEDDVEHRYVNRYRPLQDAATFRMQMFGINQQNEDVCIWVDHYQPFFFVKVSNDWTTSRKNQFFEHLKKMATKNEYSNDQQYPYYASSILSCKLVERKKLNLFDAGAQYRFIEIKFANMAAFNRIKRLWYTPYDKKTGQRQLIPGGYVFDNTSIELYEAQIPALLRYFHIQEFSPSGWVSLPASKTIVCPTDEQRTYCALELTVSHQHVKPVSDMETPVEYESASFDIEASSSHGDFPVPIKSYKKLAYNIVDYWIEHVNTHSSHASKQTLLLNVLLSAFRLTTSQVKGIEYVYPKEPITDRDTFLTIVESFLTTSMTDRKDTGNPGRSSSSSSSSTNARVNAFAIEYLFEQANRDQLAELTKDKKKGTDTDQGEGKIKPISKHQHGTITKDKDQEEEDQEDQEEDDKEEEEEDQENQDQEDDKEEEEDQDQDQDRDGDQDQEEKRQKQLNLMYDTNEESNEQQQQKEDRVIRQLFSSLSFLSGYAGQRQQQQQQHQQQPITIIDILSDSTLPRETKINALIVSLGEAFPPLEGDKVTFIGTTFKRITQHETEPYLNHCIVLNSCVAELVGTENVVIECYETEREVLLAWTALIQRMNPSIVLGYNIFNFDYEFMFRRAQELGCVDDFLQLSKNKEEICGIKSKEGTYDLDRSTTQLASGSYDLSIIKMNGRLQVDMLMWFRRNENLASYKLDYVGGQYIGDDVQRLVVLPLEEDEDQPTEDQPTEDKDKRTRIYTKNMMGLHVGGYIHFEVIDHSTNYYKQGAKFEVCRLSSGSTEHKENWFEIRGVERPEAKHVRWGLAKDDLTPKDIFRMTNEGAESRAVVAKYCMQDCNLVHHLFSKMDVLVGFSEMARLCCVPMSYLVFRGQGIKLLSFMAKKCRERKVLLPVLGKGESDEGYEGAIVLDPKCGLYLDDPVPVGDFASLYPSSMLSENLCPSSKVWTKTYDLAGNLVGEQGEKNADGMTFRYDNLPGYEYVDIEFDTYRYIRKNAKAAALKVKSGHRHCRFAQPLVVDGKEQKAIIPSILQELLQARKATRKLIGTFDDPFMDKLLDKRQLAYKLNANALYGILGAKTSDFYEPDIAASTTATGRKLLTFAKRIVEECYDHVDVETKYGMVNVTASYVYGDTDSVFFKFNLVDVLTGTKISGERALELTIGLAQEVCHQVSKVLKQPHDFEYEKTYYPLLLLSKKKYAAIKYEYDHHKGKRNDMGSACKRREYSPIVKDVYGGTIEILLMQRNVKMAMDFVHKSLTQLIQGQVSMDKLIMSKSLRSFYKYPDRIAHNVLALRMAERDPGSKPTSGDRIPFVFVVPNMAEITARFKAKQDKEEREQQQQSLTKNKSKSKSKATLPDPDRDPDPATAVKVKTKPKVKPKKPTIKMSDRIESPTYVMENHIKIDYAYYVTNQIMKPLLQVFGLVIEEICMYSDPVRKAIVPKLNRDIAMLKATITDDPKKLNEKINQRRNKDVKEVIFDDHLIKTVNAANGNQEIETMSVFIKRNKKS